MTASPPYDTVSTTSRQPILTKCCCCIPLRIGCFILGYISLLTHCMQTLALLTLTTYIGVTTHGFDHFDKGPRQVDQGPQIESVDKQFLRQIGILLTIILCANLVWLIVNVACLVGLHKKRPGPIRVFVGFATVRLLISMAGFIYVTMTHSNTKTLIAHSADLGLAAYFILVYYIYAAQLERERARSQETFDVSTNDIAFVYPTKTNKEFLVA